MAAEKTRAELIHTLLEDKYDSQLEEEELMHLLVEQKVSRNTDSIHDKNLALGDRMADRLAKFAGSWPFIFLCLGCLLGWIVLNVRFLVSPFDPYPFILLNLVLSCIAAIQAPVIMMSQNRQEEKDRLRSLNDYKTNLKTELIIEDLHQKLDDLLENQTTLLNRLGELEEQAKKQS